jgi:ABC-2 type transport system permease protein
MIARIWSLVIKEFIHLRRDWFMPVFMVIGGALELIIIGWATSRPIQNLPLMVFDQDQTTASRQMVAALENTTTFELHEWVTDLQAIEGAIDRGLINAALIIPPGFEAKVTSSIEIPTMMIVLNGAESFAEFSERMLIRESSVQGLSLESFEPSVRIWFNESLSEAFYTVPAEMALMLEFVVLIFAAIAFARERELGTLEQLLVMPFSSFEIIVGKSIPAVFIAFVNFMVMLVLVQFFFDIPLRGSLVFLLLIALVYILVELGKGMVISVNARTQHQAFLLVLLIGMTDVVFTGYAAPVESMPPFLQLVANFIPAHHWLVVFRGILLKGVGLEVLWPHVLALLILGIVIGGFSTIFVRKALN